MSVLEKIYAKAKLNPQKVAFPEAHNEKIIAIINTASRNCLWPSLSTIPKRQDRKAFCQSSNLNGPGAKGPSVWYV